MPGRIFHSCLPCFGASASSPVDNPIRELHELNPPPKFYTPASNPPNKKQSNKKVECKPVVGELLEENEVETFSSSPRENYQELSDVKTVAVASSDNLPTFCLLLIISLLCLIRVSPKYIIERPIQPYGDKYYSLMSFVRCQTNAVVIVNDFIFYKLADIACNTMCDVKNLAEIYRQRGFKRIDEFAFSSLVVISRNRRCRCRIKGSRRENK